MAGSAIQGDAPDVGPEWVLHRMAGANVIQDQHDVHRRPGGGAGGTDGPAPATSAPAMIELL